MELFVFFLLVALILILFGAGTALIWYGAILLKDKDCFLTFCAILLIIFGASFVLIGVGTVACLLTIG